MFGASEFPSGRVGETESPPKRSRKEFEADEKMSLHGMTPLPPHWILMQRETIGSSELGNCRSMCSLERSIGNSRIHRGTPPRYELNNNGILSQQFLGICISGSYSRRATFGDLNFKTKSLTLRLHSCACERILQLFSYLHF